MTEPQVRQGRGCFFYGCLTTVIVLIVVTVALSLGLRSAYKRMVDQLTETTPLTLPKVEMSESERSALAARVKTFKDALDAGQAPAPLTFTEKELNAFLDSLPDLQKSGLRAFVQIADDQLKGQVSIPLDDIAQKTGFTRLKGRYLNGAAGLKASLDNGVLMVTLQSLEVKGTPIPESAMAQFRQQNLAKDVYANPQSADFIRKFESLAIRDGTLTIKARPPTAPPEPR